LGTTENLGCQTAVQQNLSSEAEGTKGKVCIVKNIMKHDIYCSRAGINKMRERASAARRHLLIFADTF
jgi:hypothetical protein